jgi:phospholipid transport system substrate-binding protein
MKKVYPRSVYLFIAFILTATALASAPSKAEKSGAIDVVDTFHAALLDSMKSGKKLGIKGRYEVLAPVIEGTFDLQTTVRVATGNAWRKASKSEKNKLVDAFRHWSISTYASQFSGYSGQSFKTHGEKPGPQRTQLVKTDIERPGKKPVGLTYVLKEKKKKWRIVDVLLENSISQLAVRRSEYRGILQNGGLMHLVDTLKALSNKLLNP